MAADMGLIRVDGCLGAVDLSAKNKGKEVTAMQYEKPNIVSLTLAELENAKIIAMLQQQEIKPGEGGGGCQCQCQCQCQAQ
jgi:hypothetical protein